MPEYLLDFGAVTLRPADVVGKGGEADIFRTKGRAYKVFKQPNHPDLAGMPALQQQAGRRIALHQLKLPALMALAPKLPTKVVVPAELMRDKRGAIVGYRMNFIDGAEVLYRYGERDFREQGASDDIVRDIFVDLHRTVDAAHRAGLVFGDFNDLNVLVRERDAFVIDADSAMFGHFPCVMFTAGFVDPLICDPSAHAPMMVGMHSRDTDWYAYVIMLMRSLLYVGPYGGVFRPKGRAQQVPHEARPLRRITVFNDDVIYPKPARSYRILPDELLGFFASTFEKDMRGVPPISLVENLRFTTCAACGTVHARGVCPQCVGSAPVAVREVHTGTVKGVKLFGSLGRILFAAIQKGSLRYLYHHEGRYKREGGRTVVQADLEPSIRFRICGDTTMLARSDRCLVFAPGASAPEQLKVDSYGMLPLIDANADNLYFADGGGLYRTSELGAGYREHVGDVLQNQTLFWVGDSLGFGFYRAAEISNFFVFRAGHRGLNDTVALPPIRGQLVDSTCVFGSGRVWFFTVTQEGGTIINRCHLIGASGALLGSAEGLPGDGTWLGKIRGATAAGDFLLVPTDDGVLKIALSGANLTVAKEYPDTRRFVDSGSNLLLGNEGLVSIRNSEIWRLTVG